LLISSEHPEYNLQMAQFYAQFWVQMNETLQQNVNQRGQLLLLLLLLVVVAVVALVVVVIYYISVDDNVQGGQLGR
jgi:ABC-type lipoprotein release transport system permease subunit